MEDSVSPPAAQGVVLGGVAVLAICATLYWWVNHEWTLKDRESEAVAKTQQQGIVSPFYWDTPARPKRRQIPTARVEKLSSARAERSPSLPSSDPSRSLSRESGNGSPTEVFHSSVSPSALVRKRAVSRSSHSPVGSARGGEAASPSGIRPVASGGSKFYADVLQKRGSRVSTRDNSRQRDGSTTRDSSTTRDNSSIPRDSSRPRDNSRLRDSSTTHDSTTSRDSSRPRDESRLRDSSRPRESRNKDGPSLPSNPSSARWTELESFLAEGSSDSNKSGLSYFWSCCFWSACV